MIKSASVHGILAHKPFAYVTGADFIVRSAYQMGKTPLLPIFAATLGAEGGLLGFIVSVSTLTGMVLKPFVGVLSDRWGRRCWLIAGTAFFILMPFVYRFVSTPEQLFAVRVIHGMATAIYGPVTLAYVAEISSRSRAERLGWFGMAKKGGYIVGPAVAGWMLLFVDPVSVFTVIGLVSSLALLPVLLLPERSRGDSPRRRPLVPQAVASLVSGARTPSVWLAGGMEGGMYIALYSVRAFLPLFALSAGFNVAVVGIFFSVQEAVHLALSPVGGRLGDRIGHLSAIPMGMIVAGVALSLLTVNGGVVFLMGLAALIGAAQALAFPSTLALVSSSVGERHLATGLGLVGTLKNAGKVAGPTLAGVMIARLDYELTFLLMGAGLLVGAAILVAALLVRQHPRLLGRQRQDAVTGSAGVSSASVRPE